MRAAGYTGGRVVSLLALGCATTPRSRRCATGFHGRRRVRHRSRGDAIIARVRWPSSWAELRAFDDAWHADSLAGAGGRRIPWSRLSGSATAIEPDGKLVISVVETERRVRSESASRFPTVPPSIGSLRLTCAQDRGHPP